MARVGIGVRDHSGWAVAVAVAARRGGVDVVDRRRLLLCPERVPRMMFHAAAQGPPAGAASAIELAERSVQECTARAVTEITEALAGGGHTVAGIAVAHGPPRLPCDLDGILASHAFVHAAEADLYRRALVERAEAAGLRVVRYAPKTAIADAAAATGTRPEQLEATLSAVGEELGPPWQKDHREAVAAALVVLAGRGADRPSPPSRRR